MIYLTYAEPPSGVFSSQVIDVIKFIHVHTGVNIRLVSFISLHDFSKHKAAIKKQLPEALVLPMLPKATYWKINSIILWFLCSIIKPYAILARNVIACNMALKVRGKSTVKKVCFDGRGAIAAEWKEYDVLVVDSWKKAIANLEQKAVTESDFRIAVSEKLVEHWVSTYNYHEHTHVVIPCTLNSNFKPINPTVQTLADSRKKLGIKDDAIVFVYSGSTAGWQSFSILHSYISHYLKNYPQCNVLFLSPEEENIHLLEKEFPGQVLRKWVAHQEVTSVLESCDYGLLIREQTITNKVASPTKFAEYLSSGLPVIISENLGDYSAFVQKHQCGYVVSSGNFPQPKNTDIETRIRLMNLVQECCTKDAFRTEYRKLIDAISA